MILSRIFDLIVIWSCPEYSIWYDLLQKIYQLGSGASKSIGFLMFRHWFLIRDLGRGVSTSSKKSPTMHRPILRGLPSKYKIQYSQYQVLSSARFIKYESLDGIRIARMHRSCTWSIFVHILSTLFLQHPETTGLKTILQPPRHPMSRDQGNRYE